MKADAELIARVLDGRATPEERERVLAEADESPELLALLADTAAALDSGAAAVSREGRRRLGRPAMIGIGVGLIAAATTLFLILPGESGEIPRVPFPTAIGVTDLGPARVGPNTNFVRGATDAERALQSVTIGARLTDYQVLGADTARETAALEIANALRAMPGGEVAAARFAPQAVVDDDAIEAVEAIVDVPTFRAAQWAELTRLAALANDWRTLTRGDLRGALSAAADDRQLGSLARQRAASVSAQINAGTDAPLVAQLANQMLIELGRP